MIIFVEATNDIDKDIILSFKRHQFNTRANEEIINWFIGVIYKDFKGKYSKEDLMTAFNRLYRRNITLRGEREDGKSKSANPPPPKFSNLQIQDSDPDSYEASPNIIQRLYNPRDRAPSHWGTYRLNKFEQDIVNFINTNSHSKMETIRKKPAFRNLVTKLIKNAPVQKILYRKENSPRFNKTGDIVSFDMRSFSLNPYSLMLTKFSGEPGQEVLYRVTGFRGINIGVYDDFTNLSMYEDEYLCIGDCRISTIGKTGNTLLVDAKAI
jgi:hypothetical protein